MDATDSANPRLQVDGDGNELLDASEFQGLHAAMVERGICASGLSCEEALKSLDRDGDGEIKLEEFVAEDDAGGGRRLLRLGNFPDGAVPPAKRSPRQVQKAGLKV